MNQGSNTYWLLVWVRRKAGRQTGRQTGRFESKRRSEVKVELRWFPCGCSAYYRQRLIEISYSSVSGLCDQLWRVGVDQLLHNVWQMRHLECILEYCLRQRPTSSNGGWLDESDFIHLDFCRSPGLSEVETTECVNQDLNPLPDRKGHTHAQHKAWYTRSES